VTPAIEMRPFRSLTAAAAGVELSFPGAGLAGAKEFRRALRPLPEPLRLFLGLKPLEASRFYDAADDYHVPLAPASTPAELGVVAVLRIAPGQGSFELTREQRLEILPGCVFRPRQAFALGLREVHARMIARVAGGCRMVVLDGAKQTPIRDIADRLVRAIRQSAPGGEERPDCFT
jgi:hypothetical protein